MNKNVITGGTIIVKNKDIPILANVFAVMQLVNRSEATLNWQHDKILNISQHITGMPGGGSLPEGLDSALASLQEAGEIHEDNVRQYLHELHAAERILNGIESRTMRAFVVMRYCMNMSDAEIRRDLNMSEYGVARAKKAVEEAKNMASVVWRERYILDNR